MAGASTLSQDIRARFRVASLTTPQIYVYRVLLIARARFGYNLKLLSLLCFDQVWDMNSGSCIHTLRGHNDEILDVAFNSTGSKLVTASADGNSRVYNTMTGACHSILNGHEGEISKVTFNPQGSRILTASSDKTARIWETETGDCLQVLEGHTDEIFSCAFNYEGDTIITGSKDNTCRIWKC